MLLASLGQFASELNVAESSVWPSTATNRVKSGSSGGVKRKQKRKRKKKTVTVRTTKQKTVDGSLNGDVDAGVGVDDDVGGCCGGGGSVDASWIKAEEKRMATLTRKRLASRAIEIQKVESELRSLFATKSLEFPPLPSNSAPQPTPPTTPSLQTPTLATSTSQLTLPSPTALEPLVTQPEESGVLVKDSKGSLGLTGRVGMFQSTAPYWRKRAPSTLWIDRFAPTSLDVMRMNIPEAQNKRTSKKAPPLTFATVGDRVKASSNPTHNLREWLKFQFNLPSKVFSINRVLCVFGPHGTGKSMAIRLALHELDIANVFSFTIDHKTSDKERDHIVQSVRQHQVECQVEYQTPISSSVSVDEDSDGDDAEEHKSDVVELEVNPRSSKMSPPTIVIIEDDGTHSRANTISMFQKIVSVSRTPKECRESGANGAMNIITTIFVTPIKPYADLEWMMDRVEFRKLYEKTLWRIVDQLKTKLKPLLQRDPTMKFPTRQRLQILVRGCNGDARKLINDIQCECRALIKSKQSSRGSFRSDGVPGRILQTSGHNISNFGSIFDMVGRVFTYTGPRVDWDMFESLADVRTRDGKRLHELVVVNSLQPNLFTKRKQKSHPGTKSKELKKKKPKKLNKQELKRLKKRKGLAQLRTLEHIVDLTHTFSEGDALACTTSHNFSMPKYGALVPIVATHIACSRKLGWGDGLNIKASKAPYIRPHKRPNPTTLQRFDRLYTNAERFEVMSHIGVTRSSHFDPPPVVQTQTESDTKLPQASKKKKAKDPKKLTKQKLKGDGVCKHLVLSSRCTECYFEHMCIECFCGTFKKSYLRYVYYGDNDVDERMKLYKDGQGNVKRAKHVNLAESAWGGEGIDGCSCQSKIYSLKKLGKCVPQVI